MNIENSFKTTNEEERIKLFSKLVAYLINNKE